MEHKISAGAFTASLVLSRVFTEATVMPYESVSYGMQRFSVVAVSFLLTFVMYIPVMMIAKNGGSLLSPIAGRSRAAAVASGILPAAYMLLMACGTGLRSHYYTSSTVFDSAPSLYFCVIMGAVVLFAVIKGQEPLMRASLIVAAVAVMLFILMSAALIPEIKPDRLYPALADNGAVFMNEVTAELSRNSEVLIFACLSGNIRSSRITRSSPARCVPAYLGISCGVILYMTFLYNTVFGRLTSQLAFPFYTLSSVSDITILHRINGIDVMIWAMSAAIKISLFAFSFREMVLTCFRSSRAADICAVAFAGLSVIMTWLFTGMPRLSEQITHFMSTGIPLVLTAVIIPVISLAAGSIGKKESEA